MARPNCFRSSGESLRSPSERWMVFHVFRADGRDHPHAPPRPGGTSPKEARVARYGLLFLAAGLCLTAVSNSYPVLFTAFTLMPLGTAFLFPCVTSLLSRVVPRSERGLQMGVQQTYGGILRVAFPIGAGALVDQFDAGVPFLVAGLLVLLTLAMTSSLEASLGSAPA